VRESVEFLDERIVTAVFEDDEVSVGKRFGHRGVRGHRGLRVVPPTHTSVG
jgi:hypothetical protein